VGEDQGEGINKSQKGVKRERWVVESAINRREGEASICYARIQQQEEEKGISD